MNKYSIKLKSNKQLLDEPIYSLGLVELEILKTYIKIDLVTGFIWLSKFSASVYIFFV